MDVILTDSRLDTGIKRCIPMNEFCTNANMCRRSTKGNTKFIKQLETVQMTVATKNKTGMLKYEQQYS